MNLFFADGSGGSCLIKSKTAIAKKVYVVDQ